MYQVKFENFEGPLDLLLDLFEKKKLDITKLSLSKVADDFLAYLDNGQATNLDNLSSFLLTASQLILIKSKALLPLFEFTKEEEEEIEDLQARLIEYRKFKEAAEGLNQKILKNERCFFRSEEKFSFGRFVSPGLSKERLAEIYDQIKMEITQEDGLSEEIMRDVMTLEEKIGQMKASLEKRMRIAFRETIKESRNKAEVIISFLAILEMIKQKIVLVEQAELFSDIWISKTTK
jgi:segregation and condensation protein A